MRFLVSLTLLAVFVVSHTPAQEPKGKGQNGPQWTVWRLKIQKTSDNFDDGTMVGTLLCLPERFIVGVDLAKSNVKITDDKNADLLQITAAEMYQPIKEPAVSRDGKFVRLTFGAPGNPAKNATVIRIKGSITVVVGKNEKEIVRKDVSLGKSIDLPIGTLNPGSTDMKRRGQQFGYDGSLPLKNLVLIDGKGSEFTYRLISRYKTRFDPSEFHTYLGADNPGKKIAADRCTLRVTYFDTFETIIVPIELDVGLGF